MKDIEKYKPGVTRAVLLMLAGIVWVGVGTMLAHLGFSWLSTVSGLTFYLYAGSGIVVALLVHHFGFLRIVDKNLKRILQMKGKRCLFAFIPWKSYLTIAVMVLLGALLRHSMIPKEDLAILYIGIGLALILSSIRYVRVFYCEMTR